MITISRPVITGNRTVSTVTVDDKKFECWFETDDEFAVYLSDLTDPFVIGLLPGAMKGHHDIVCEGKLTDELYFNLVSMFIPAVVKYDSTLKPVKITGELVSEDETIDYGKKRMIGAGLTMGVDSMYVLKKYRDTGTRFDLDCFSLFDIGNWDIYRDRDYTEKSLMERTRVLAGEIGLPIVYVKSNLAAVFPRLYRTRITYYHIACVIAMKNLFSRYYAASSYTVEDMTLVDNSSGGVFDEYFLFNTFTTKELRILNLPVEADRIEKTLELADYDLARRYLHVCRREPYNCGLCKKCRRTLVTLDVLDKLDNFSAVFDIDYYRKNRREYFEWMLVRGNCDDHFCRDLAVIMSKKYPKFAKTVSQMQNETDAMFMARHKTLNAAESEALKKEWPSVSDAVAEILVKKLKDIGAETVTLYGKNYREKDIKAALAGAGIAIDREIANSRELAGIEDYGSDAMIVCSSTTYSVGQARLMLDAMKITPVIYTSDIVSGLNE